MIDSVKIIVCGQQDASKLAAETKIKTSIISITSKGQKDVIFPDNPNILSILHLKINDLIKEYDKEGLPYGGPLPEQEDLSGLKEFVDTLSCECLIIHCWEGISRSAAIARAVYEYRGGIDDVQTMNRVFPNNLVYDLACRELGI